MTQEDLAEVLTGKFSEIELMKEINRRWNKHNKNKENNHVKRF